MKDDFELKPYFDAEEKDQSQDLLDEIEEKSYDDFRKAYEQKADAVPDSEFILDDDFIMEKAEEPVSDQHLQTEEDVADAQPASVPSKPEAKTGRKKKKKKSCLSTTLWMLGVAVVSISLATVIFLGISDMLGIGPGKGQACSVVIEQGMTTKEIAQTLKENGAINSTMLFRLYTKLSNFDGKYKYGFYTFNNEIGYEGIAIKLQTEGAQAKAVEVTIPEMASVDTIAVLMEEKGVCTTAEFKSAVNQAEYNYDFVAAIPQNVVYYLLEGYLFPDTYQFYSYEDGEECARLAVEKMLDELNKKWTPAMQRRAEEMGRSLHEILTMASIIEAEASGRADEMPKVSAVFYNRLNWDERKLLGSDPTMKYPYGNGRYNTRKIEGLPPGPICSPSLNAINAALYPAENFGFTYFLTDSDMNFYYFNSYEEHLNKRQELIRQGKWVE